MQPQKDLEPRHRLVNNMACYLHISGRAEADCHFVQTRCANDGSLQKEEAEQAPRGIPNYSTVAGGLLTEVLGQSRVKSEMAAKKKWFVV